MTGRTSPQPENGLSLKGFLILIIEAISFSVEVFLRRDFGCRYIGNRGPPSGISPHGLSRLLARLSIRGHHPLRASLHALGHLRLVPRTLASGPR